MKPKKPKAKAPVAVVLIVSEDGLLGALNRYADVKIDLAARQAAHEQRIAALNTEFDAEVQPLREEILRLEGSIQLYCENNRPELFGADRKSKEFSNVTVGFRLNPPAVAKLLPKDTFEAIAERLEQLDWGEQYLTYKPATVNKDALLKDRATLTDQQLREAGIRFDQTETFFIDLKASAADGTTKVLDTAAA